MKKSALIAFLDDVGDAVILFDISGVVVYSNKYARHLTELFNESKSRLIHPVLAHAANDLLEKSEKISEKIDLTVIGNDFENYDASIYLVDKNLVLLSVKMSYERKSKSMVDTFIQIINNEVTTPLQSLVLGWDLLERMFNEKTQISNSDFSEIKNLTFSNAQKSLDVLKKILDVFYLYGDVPLRDDERIHPVEILCNVVDSCREDALEKKQVIRLETNEVSKLGMLYGSKAWLIRAIKECLMEAMTQSDMGTIISVNLRQVGSFALINIKNQGKRNTSSSSKVYEPLLVNGMPDGIEFLSKNKRDRVLDKSKIELGFSIANRVIDLHGGTIRSSGMDDSVEYCIEIPTGTSVTENKDNSVEQAIRYATDLSAILKLVKYDSILVHEG